MPSDLNRVTEALSDRYEILPELGRGGTANVYLAKDLRHVPIISSKEQGRLLGIVTLNDIARQRFAEETD